MEGSNFEQLRHQIFDNETLTVPLFIDEDRGLTEESNTLLQAATIIGANLKNYDGDISKVVDRVGGIISNPDEKGMIIEGVQGMGSVAIDSQITQIYKPGSGKFVIPTEKVFDMLYAWSEYSRDNGQNS